VYPSDGAVAMCWAAILPPAPALFSTMTGCPMFSLSFCAMILARCIGASAGRKADGQRDGAAGEALRARGSGDNHCRRRENHLHRSLHPESPEAFAAWASPLLQDDVGQFVVDPPAAALVDQNDFAG
jgi:hypothetical protein